MSDETKEIAEELWRVHNCLVNIENFGNYSLERVITKENFIKALTEYESSEIARLRGIINRAKNVEPMRVYDNESISQPLINALRQSEVLEILSEAEEV